MDRPIKILLVGVGGYGETYLDALLNCKDEDRGKFSIEGAVDPSPQSSSHYQELIEKGIPFYDSMEAFYAQSRADLAIISSPIQFHCSQTLLALSHGSHVLCEKPLSADAAQGRQMIEAQRKSGKILAIGYQWSFSQAILTLKQDVLQGLYGRPIRCKAIVLWPKPYSYYSRNKWAGKIKDDAGNPIRDSVANNAAAHYLHNLLFILGSRMEWSSCPLSVSAELYRANRIENFDTCIVRSRLGNGVRLMYYASHAVDKNRNPAFVLEFEKGEIRYDQDAGGILEGRLNDGTVKSYGSPNEPQANKLWVTLDAIRNGGSVPCTAETAFSHTMFIEGMQQSMPDISGFPDSMLREDTLMLGEHKGICAKGLFEVLKDCYEKWTTPWDMGLPWAKKAKEIHIEQYRE